MTLELTQLSNFLYDHLSNGCVLQYGIAKHCRCLGCWEWQIVDSDDVVIASADSLEDFIKKD